MVKTSYSGGGVPDYQEGGSVWQQEDYGDVVTDPGRCDKNLNTESRNNTEEEADYRGTVDVISVVLGVGGGAESTMGVFPDGGWESIISLVGLSRRKKTFRRNDNDFTCVCVAVEVGME